MLIGMTPDSTNSSGREFPATAWTMVVQARGEDDGAQLALEHLCAIYWSPLYAFARRSGLSREDAEDATQEFFGRLIGGEYLERAQRDKGRLRTFLLTCFKRFLSDRRAKAQAQKRGGGKEILSFDVAGIEGHLALEGEHDSPETLFERRWAHAMLAETLEELEQEYGGKGKAEMFSALKDHLMPGAQEAGYHEVAGKLGMQENAVGVAVYRLRRRFGELMKRQVLATVGSEGEVEAELRHLMGALA